MLYSNLSIDTLAVVISVGHRTAECWRQIHRPDGKRPLSASVRGALQECFATSEMPALGDCLKSTAY
jgi:hypothetical protein